MIDFNLFKMKILYIKSKTILFQLIDSIYKWNILTLFTFDLRYGIYKQSPLTSICKKTAITFFQI